jgi:hypothetical protein
MTNEDSKQNPAWIEEIDLGAFKKKEDHGEALRKIAYIVQDVIYERRTDQVADLILSNIAKQGIPDPCDDCIIQNLNMLSKFSERSSVLVAGKMEEIMVSLEKVFAKNLKTMLKADRAERIINASLRALHSMVHSSELKVNKSQTLDSFIATKVKSNKDLEKLWAKL